ncbi:MAG: SDR family NAD(P)-dependent oxidoreductase [Proteobacteria bacterium]|nr:SDR family NAD(P)-dependent oxidoreductase [Pseudomonadota bacterium]
MDLDGKVALVTGASRGVGAATAVALAEAGCDVAVAARATRASPQKLPGTLDETLERIERCGRRGLAVATNLAREDEVERMVQRTAEHFGRLDVLVNNAAITFVGDLDIPLKRHDLIMEVNLRAPLLAMRHVVPHMLAAGGGGIVNVSSAASLSPLPGLMSYGISKAGLERASVDVGNQMQDRGIAVNCFRIDIPCASEGFVANTPEAERVGWEPCEVPAEGIRWVLEQPLEFSGHLLSMFELRRDRGIMASRLEQPYAGRPPTRIVTGLVARGETMFRDA